MLAHLGVVALAAPLIAIGLAGTRWDILGRSPLSAPILASLLELVVVWAWHAPALRALAAGSAWVTAAEQASFLVAGLLLWLACFGEGGARTDARRAAGAFAMLLTSMHMTLLGVLLALTPRPLYGRGEVTCLGLTMTAEQDQELGGVLMLLVGAAVYLAGGVVLLGRLLTAAEPARKA
jgi:putative membrane protein